MHFSHLQDSHQPTDSHVCKSHFLCLHTNDLILKLYSEVNIRIFKCVFIFPPDLLFAFPMEKNEWTKRIAQLSESPVCNKIEIDECCTHSQETQVISKLPLLRCMTLIR